MLGSDRRNNAAPSVIEAPNAHTQEEARQEKCGHVCSGANSLHIQRFGLSDSQLHSAVGRLQHLPSAATVQQSDFERSISLIQKKQSFVCKLHGSISSVQRTVFTAEEYQKLDQDSRYLALMKHIFAEATIVFVGYGLKDEYVLKALSLLDAESKVFGNGPHFLITSSTSGALPSSVIPLTYFVGMHRDHRATNMALDIIQASRQGMVERNSEYCRRSSSGYRVEEHLKLFR
jgi:hypothetical protein